MFKDLLVKLIQDKGITAYKLSKDTGISEALISNWKTGRQLPKYDSIVLLCDYFGVSADYLLERTEIPENPNVKPKKYTNLAHSRLALGFFIMLNHNILQ